MVDIKSKSPTASFTPPAKGTGSIFELVLLVVIAALVFFFLLNPKRTEYSQSQQSLAQLQSNYQNLKSEEANLDALVKSMKANPKGIAEMDEALPLNGRLTRLRLNLEYITKSSGMAVGDISVSPPDSDQIIAGNRERLANPYGVARKVQTYQCGLTVTGTTEQFQSLLQKLENSGRIFDIIGMDVASSKDNTLDFKLNLVAYAYE